MSYSVVSAHPGRTDSNGGHWNRKTGTYHYHSGSSSSSGNTTIINSGTSNDMVSREELIQKENDLIIKDKNLKSRLDLLEKEISNLETSRIEIESLIKELTETYKVKLDFEDSYVYIPYISTRIIRLYLPEDYYIYRENTSTWQVKLISIESDLKFADEQLTNQESTTINTKGKLDKQKTNLINKKNEVLKNTVVSKLKGYNYMKQPDLVTIPINKDIFVTFSQKIDFTTINKNTIELADMSSGNLIMLDYRLILDNKIQLTPKTPLVPDQVYSLVLHKSIKSKSGKYLSNGLLVEIKVK
jgi:hypothetical protein